MRILHIIPNIERGGAERAMLAIVKRTYWAGHEARIVVLGSKNQYPEETQDIAVEFLLFQNSYRNLWAVVRTIDVLRRVITSWQPHIVHSHLWPAARMTGWALRGSSIPHIVHVQDTMSWLYGRSFRDRVMRLLTKHALQGRVAAYIAVAEAVADYTRKAFPWIKVPIYVVYNCVDESVFGRLIALNRTSSNGDHAEICFGTASRIVPNKGHNHLLSAFAKLREKIPQSRLLVAGDGGYRPECERLAYSLGLGESVTFLGALNTQAMVDFYSTLDVFVLASTALEGLPLVILEAAAAGVPVVTTDVGGSKEAIRDGQEGLVVPPGNVDRLAEAMIRLASDEPLRKRLGAAARERVLSEFTAERMTDRVLEIYNQVLEGARPPALRA
jgi:glycosyltransferase involved in cell wall biosynthesis